MQNTNQTIDETPEEEKCACGSEISYLKEFFGEEMSGHISVCKPCGGELHVGEDGQRCIDCDHGCYAKDPDPDEWIEHVEYGGPRPSDTVYF